MGVLFVNTKSDKYDAVVKLIKIDSLNGNSEGGENKKTTKAELLANSEPVEGYFAKEPTILPRVDLPDKFFIYTKGPYRSTDTFREKELLAFWYFRCLELADSNRCRAIQIPLITADTYSYETAMQIAYDTCKLYFKYKLQFMEVYIVLPSRSVNTDRENNQAKWIIDCEQREFNRLSSYIDQNYRYDTHQQELSEPDSPEEEFFPVSKVINEDYYTQKKQLEEYLNGEKAAPGSKSDSDKQKPDIQWKCLCQTVGGEGVKEKHVEVYFQTGSARPNLPDKEDLMIEETFREMLLRLMNEKDMSAPEVYTKACMDRKLFSKILSSDDYQPRKYTVVRLALALDLSLDETNEFMKNAGFALSHGKLKDLVIEYCIKNDIRSVNTVNKILEERGHTSI